MNELGRTTLDGLGFDTALMNMPQLTVEEALMNLEEEALMNLEGAATQLMNLDPKGKIEYCETTKCGIYLDQPVALPNPYAYHMCVDQCWNKSKYSKPPFAVLLI